MLTPSKRSWGRQPRGQRLGWGQRASDSTVGRRLASQRSGWAAQRPALGGRAGAHDHLVDGERAGAVVIEERVQRLELLKLCTAEMIIMRRAGATAFAGGGAYIELLETALQGQQKVGLGRREGGGHRGSRREQEGAHHRCAAR